MGKRTITRCYQIIARTPHVVAATGEQQDFTYLSECGAPVTKYGKCAKHQDQGHDRIDYMWRRFVRQTMR